MIPKRVFQTAERGPGAIAIACLVILCLHGDAFAATGTVIRENDETGDYAIDFGRHCSDQCRLEESSDFGNSWTVLTGWMRPPNVPAHELTGKPIGTYQYRIYDVEIKHGRRERMIEYVDIAEVVVGPPPSLEEQMGYSYEVRVGDFDADGLEDLYVARTSPATANNGAIDDTVLRQTPSGLFEMRVPDGYQSAVAASWPETGVQVVKSDIDLDGFVDLRLKNVDAAISGADDQILFSPAVAYTESARTVRAIDTSLEGTITDLVTQYFDESFIPGHATTVIKPGKWKLGYDCGFEWRDQYGWDWECWTVYQWEPGGTATTYPGIDGQAAEIWKASVAAADAQGSWRNVIEKVADVLGTVIDLDKWCISIYGDADAELCAGAALPAVLAALMDATEDPRGPGARRPGTIYITGRRLSMVGAKHTALEYTDPVTGATVHFAAYNHNSLTDGNQNIRGRLRALTDFSWDDKDINVTFGTVSHPVLSPSVHWFTEVLAAHQQYLSNGCELIYYAAPGLTVTVNDYNSNGYVKGVIDAADGIAATSWPAPGGEPIGWDVPVPGAWFADNPPACPQ